MSRDSELVGGGGAKDEPRNIWERSVLHSNKQHYTSLVLVEV